MDSKTAAAASLRSYEDFEPFCLWEREDAQETLTLHLPDFKKDQLKVQVNSQGLLKISGERAVSETKRSRFSKETRVPKDSIANDIRAKLARGGYLHVVMPKKVTPAPAPLGSKTHEHQRGENPKLAGEGDATEPSGWVWRLKAKLGRNSSAATAIGLGGVAVLALAAYFAYTSGFSRVVED
ncbi:uncharacterized protein LOC131168142 [Malania oleifera]|uniref:uncharacterized protein LOC131168142 n=1 Tax=Malania oleifera TaxID=397392 RepID=UPI0025AEA0FA|nr:uncharacterized protein LOC131168142 [Malania oleifera]